MTARQQHALETVPAQFIGLQQSHTGKLDLALDFEQCFGRPAPSIVDIGFGMGKALLETAKAHPEYNYLGVEVHRPGVGALLANLAEEKVDNVRVICQDVVEVFTHAIADASLEGIQIFFPDPWPKRRHRKRRLVNEAFVQLILPKLKPGGLLHIVTDCDSYAQPILSCLENQPMLKAVDVNELQGRRVTTKYEQRAQRLGHKIWEIGSRLIQQHGCSTR